jgi:hypothetical protein
MIRISQYIDNLIHITETAHRQALPDTEVIDTGSANEY